MDEEQFLINNQFEIIDVLRSIADSKSQLSIKLYNTDNNFLSTCNGIIYYDKTKKTFEIETFTSSISNKSSTSNSKYLKVETKLHGINIVFQTSIIKNQEDRASIIFHINLPTSLYKFQRRNAFRVIIPHYYDIFLLFSQNQKSPILNLSDSGALILITPETQSIIKPNSLIKDVKIFINSEISYNLDLNVKYITEIYDEKTTHKKLCAGLHFTKFSPGLYNELSLTVNNIIREAKTKD